MLECNELLGPSLSCGRCGEATTGLEARDPPPRTAQRLHRVRYVWDPVSVRWELRDADPCHPSVRASLSPHPTPDPPCPPLQVPPARSHRGCRNGDWGGEAPGPAHPQEERSFSPEAGPSQVWLGCMGCLAPGTRHSCVVPGLGACWVRASHPRRHGMLAPSRTGGFVDEGEELGRRRRPRAGGRDGAERARGGAHTGRGLRRARAGPQGLVRQRGYRRAPARTSRGAGGATTPGRPRWGEREVAARLAVRRGHTCVPAGDSPLALCSPHRACNRCTQGLALAGHDSA